MPENGLVQTLKQRNEQPITARLASAGSVRRELEDLLQRASPDADQEEYRRLVIEENVTGKRTESSRAKTWTNLKGRYLLDPDAPEFVDFRDRLARTGNARDRGLLCYLMMARTDRLFRELSLKHIIPMTANPDSLVSNDVLEDVIEKYGVEHGGGWTAQTIVTVRQHFLSALKDFGILRGTARKYTLSIQPGMNVVLFAARLGKLEGLTDRQVLEARWFRLLGLRQDAVVDRLYAAAQQGAISFRKQAEVVELEFLETAET